MNFRAQIGHDLSSTLESSTYFETSIDRIAAFSRSPRLGCHLWRLKFGFDSTVYQGTINLLAKESRIDTEKGRKLCELVLREWLNPLCEACFGAKELILENKRITCTQCHGLGLKRFTNRERAEFMQMPLEHWKAIARLYKRVLENLTKAERRVNAQMHFELER